MDKAANNEERFRFGLALLVLSGAIATRYGWVAHTQMFGLSAIYSFSPELEASRFQIFSHESNDLLFVQTKLKFNGFEGCSVLPCHFYHS